MTYGSLQHKHVHRLGYSAIPRNALLCHKGQQDDEVIQVKHLHQILN